MSSCNGSPEPIAIIGMACRLPGEVTSPSKLWDLLVEERSGQSDVPRNRFNVDSWYHPDKMRPGSISTRGGYFLGEDDSYRQFDPFFFGINPKEAASMDPQQRKLLEVVYESFEAAGARLEDVSGSKTACYVGNFTWDVGQMQARDINHGAPYHMTGGGLTILSNRVNYVFNLKGPSMTIDTACSSTMYALHLACRSLQAGDCSSAVVAGTNLIFGVEQQIGSVRLGVLSPTSVCHTFDETADGYARAEAVGSLYLKTLSQAIADGDPIRAVIRGTSINANGKSPGISHPSAQDQEMVIRQAYASAGLDLEKTGYFECHGTGTPVGDPLEVSAIGKVFGDVRTAESPLLMGSVKTNLGHGEAASAISSLIKTVLCLEKGEIPATIGIKRLNPALDLRDGRLQIVQKLSSWPTAQSYRRASVNSFGYGGANAHAILDAVQSYLGSLRQNIPASLPAPENILAKKNILLPFSAHSESTLEKNIKSISTDFQDDLSLRDLAHTLSAHRSNHSARAFTIVPGDLNVAQLTDSLSSEKLTTGTAMGASPKLAFVFTGQGAQWAQMGHGLAQEYAIVRRTLQNLGEIISKLPNAPEWNLLEALAQPKSKSRVNEAEQSQPLTTAIQIAMVDLLRSWGVNPTAVVGHSSGEIAAAYTAGLISAAEAIIIAYQRGAATVKSTQHGAMLAVGMGPEEVVKVIEDIPDIGIACYNAPDSVTLSGTDEAVDEARGRFSRAGVFNRKLVTSGNAYHSQLMTEAGAHYEQSLRECLLPNDPPSAGLSTVTMFSSVTEEELPMVDLDYWRKNLESPVKFDQATQKLLKARSEVNVVIEIGPHSALAAPLKAIRSKLGYTPERFGYFSALKRNSDSVESLLKLAGSLFLSGWPIDLSTVNADETLHNDDDGAESIQYSHGAFIKDLPTYQWSYDEELLWNESRLSTDIRFRSYPHHDLLGSRLPGTSNVAPAWRNLINLENVPWLRDHKVGDDIVFPAAGYVALAVEAITQIRNSSISGMKDVYTLREVNIKAAMVLKDGLSTELMFDLRAVPGQSATYHFAVSTFSQGIWTEHATGAVQIDNESTDDRLLWPDNRNVGSRGGMNKGSYDRRWYSAMDKVGLVYGPGFKTLSDIRASPDHQQATAEVSGSATEDLMGRQSQYILHPTTIDACLQLSIIAAHHGKPESLKKVYLPVAIQKLTIWPQNNDGELPLAACGRGHHRGLRSVQTFIDLSSPNEKSILRAEISFSSLETAAVDEGTSKSPQPYTRLVWKPDFDRMSNAEANVLFHGTQEDISTSRHFFSALEEVTRLAIRSSAERLPSDLQTDNLPSHMNKFLSWLKAEGSALSVSEGHDGLTGKGLIEKIDSIVREVEHTVPEAAMVAQLNSRMPEILSGTVGTLDVMVEDNLLSKIYEDGFGQVGAYAKLGNIMELVAHKDPRLRILELGAGTGGATKPMLQALHGDTSLPKFEKYDFTDVSKAFLGVAQEKFQGYRNLDFGILDIENDPVAQGFEAGSYDIVFASNVIHATRNVASSLRNCRKLLKPNGKLIIIETTKQRQVTGFMLGALPGYWLGADDGRPSSPFLSKALWHQRLLDAGLSGADIVLDDYPEPADCTTLMVSRNTDVAHQNGTNGVNGVHSSNGSTQANGQNGTNGANGSNGVNGSNGSHATNGQNGVNGSNGHQPPQVTLIYRNKPQPFQEKIEQHYAKLGISTRSMALEDIPSLLERDSRTIMLGELEGPLMACMTPGEMQAIQRFTQLAATAIWVTNIDVLQGQDPEKSLVFGLAKSIMTEQPSFHLCSVDVDIADGQPGHQSSVDLIVDTEIAFHKDPNGELDTELIEKDGLVYISRYVTDDAENANFERHFSIKPTVTSIVESDTSKYSLEFEKVGRLDSFYFKEQALESLGEHEVLLDIQSAPLDGLSIPALKGQTSSSCFGLEMVGTVRAVGPQTSKLTKGDRVCCFYPHHFDTAIIVDESHCELLSVYERSEDLISQIHPVVTSLHIVETLLRLQSKDRVLIDCRHAHLAYVTSQVALLTGSDIHVTFSSKAGRALLQQLGDKASLVDRQAVFEKALLDASFDAILTDSKGGYQLLGNSLNHGGRITVLSNAVPGDMASAAVSFLNKGITIGVFDPIDGFAAASLQKPSSLAKALDLLRRNVIRPVLSAQYDLSDFSEAISHISQEGFVGRAVLTRAASTVVPVHTVTAPLVFNSQASYLLIGCLGGLGRSLATSMVSRGARHFIFLSRSGADKPEATALVKELEELTWKQYPDMTVQVVRGDVSIKEDVNRAILCAKQPIKGVVQAAMVLKDTLFTEMTLGQFNQVLHPKMVGTINLHELLQGHDLDFFVMTSSVLGAIGAAMQSNYSAANAYLDHMARHRQSMGLQATSIALGMILDVGHVEEHPEVEKALKRNGMYGISVDEYLLMMEFACRRRDLGSVSNSQGPFKYDPGASAHIVTGMDPTRVSRAGGKSLWLKDNRLRNLVAALGGGSEEDVLNTEQSGGANTRELLEAARTEGGETAVKSVILGLILARFSKLVLLPVQKIDPGKSLAHYGMDSMISAELKSWAWKEFTVDLPFLGLLDQGLTFDALADQVVALADTKSS
ncbi:unnamed protein product [Penicillium olsonii]|nr:unnamed protein product [Penicillium olsonii]